MRLTVDQEWFNHSVESMGAVPDRKSPYKNVYAVKSESSVELVKFFAREFDPIVHGGGWWNHKTRDLMAHLTGFNSRPGWLFVTAKPKST